MRLVVASALLWGGSPGLLLRHGQSGGNSLYTSQPLLVELARVLSRTKFEKKIMAARVTAEELVELYAGYVNLVKPEAVGRVAPDPDDDVVIGTALAAKADCVVTGDKGLLGLHHYEGIRIISTQDVLATILER
jgi:uncharacterized protein